MIRIISDGSADLPKELMMKYNISVVPLNVRIGNQNYLEGIDITPAEFFQRCFQQTSFQKLHSHRQRLLPMPSPNLMKMMIYFVLRFPQD